MKNIYTVAVYEDMTGRMESILNRFRISLKDWFRTETYMLGNERVVNYRIACTEETHISITRLLYAGC